MRLFGIAQPVRRFEDKQLLGSDRFQNDGTRPAS